MRMRKGIQASLFTLLIAGSAAAQHDHADEPHKEGQDAVGVVTFAPGCEPRSAERFEQALALKHHMMYEQARQRFTELTERDPDCAMGHWGVAATWLQPLWPNRPDEEILTRGRQAIERARDAGPGDTRETALIDAVGAYFAADDMAYRDRIGAWAEGMAEAYGAHPDDLDIASLYGLSRLALAMAADADTRNRLHDEAEAVLIGVWEQENAHPGAIHYAIHATDVDGRAENALHLVNAYAEIAPSTPHALHMPSHIHVRLGKWDEVIEWNRRSADAARSHEVNGAISFHYIHALDYLVYGYLQRGEIDRARAVWQEARDIEKHQPGFASAYHAAAMPARIAVEQRDWAAARVLTPRTPDYLPWDESFWPEGLTWYARGLGAIHEGDSERASDAEARLAELRDRAREDGEDRFAIYLEIDRKILEGWIRHASGESEKAVALMRDAADLEATVEKDPVSPGALYPPYEALGDLLLALDKPRDAVDAYQASDDIWPGRHNTLKGMTRAQEKLAGR